MYKIRNKKTGEFSSGGVYGLDTKKGKIWQTIGALKLHLNFRSYDENYEIVEYKPVEVKTIPVVRELL
tara:strand:+ start:980 stop:1183 length:204 start_codon:yes stop_codon:yes gene_type:complete